MGRLVLFLILSRGRGDRLKEGGAIGLLYWNSMLLSSREVIGILVKYVPCQIVLVLYSVNADIRSYYHFRNASIPSFDSK